MVNRLRAAGMCDVAFEAYRLACENADIDIESRDDSRVVQAIGDAPQSRGYHHADGVLNSVPYTAAADLSVRGLTNSQKATWLEELCRAGFVAFYRNWPGNVHIHANYAGVPQKSALDGQNEDFFAGRDGLVGHRRIDDEWWFPEKELRAIPERMFRESNGKRPCVVRSPLATARESHHTSPTALSYGFYLNDEVQPRFWMPVRDGVALAPVRAFGSALGLAVQYNATSRTVSFSYDDAPVAIALIEGVGHAPVRQLVREIGLKLDVDAANRKVIVTR